MENKFKPFKTDHSYVLKEQEIFCLSCFQMNLKSYVLDLKKLDGVKDNTVAFMEPVIFQF